MTILTPRFIKLGLMLATFGSAAMAQSLSSFTCSPTSIGPGASFYCTVQITSAASIAGVPISISTTSTGVSYQPTITVPWLRTSVTFSIATATSIAPQVVHLTAKAGTISLPAAVTIASSVTYAVTSVRCTPAKLIPDQTTTCLASLSGEAPAGGLVATLTSSSGHLPVPSSVSIPATTSAFQFTAKASSWVTVLETVTVKAVVASSSSSVAVKIDPTAKFYLKGNNAELSLLTNGATVRPSIGPTGWLGTLTVRGTGYVAFDPIVGSSGFNFHRNGGQNTNTAFVNFSGATCSQVFDGASEISFSLKSAYSFAERKLLGAGDMRGVFEVFDSYGSLYVFSTYTTSTGALQFSFGAGGYSGTYLVPAGTEDRVFGKGVVAKIKVKWTSSSFSLYVNGTLVQTNTATVRSATWGANSAFTIGSRSTRIGGGGYYASDDTVAEITVR